jgi:hypothetical protein
MHPAVRLRLRNAFAVHPHHPLRVTATHNKPRTPLRAHQRRVLRPTFPAGVSEATIDDGRGREAARRRPCSVTTSRAGWTGFRWRPTRRRATGGWAAPRRVTPRRGPIPAAVRPLRRLRPVRPVRPAEPPLAPAAAVLRARARRLVLAGRLPDRDRLLHRGKPRRKLPGPHAAHRPAAGRRALWQGPRADDNRTASRRPARRRRSRLPARGQRPPAPVLPLLPDVFGIRRPGGDNARYGARRRAGGTSPGQVPPWGSPRT